MTFDPKLFGQAGEVPAYTSDPSQEVGVRSTMLKTTPPRKLEQIQNQESESHLMSSVFKLRSCQQYLKVNSADPECPLTIFPVGWMSVLDDCNRMWMKMSCTGHCLYFRTFVHISDKYKDENTRRLY